MSVTTFIGIYIKKRWILRNIVQKLYKLKNTFILCQSQHQ